MPYVALANSNEMKPNNNADYDFGPLKGTYITLAAGRSFPQNKISNISIDSLGNFYYTRNKLDRGTVYKTAIGKDFEVIRAEFEFLYSKKHKFSLTTPNNILSVNGITSNFHTSHYTYFFNVFYDFKNINEVFQPYVGLGVGLSRNKVSEQPVITDIANVELYKYFKKSTNSFAWNLNVGSKINVNQHLYFDFSYKYVDLGRVKGSNMSLAPNGVVTTNADDNVKGRVRNHLLLAGFGFRF
jgi:opacity protein-like surface antigen